MGRLLESDFQRGRLLAVARGALKVCALIKETRRGTATVQAFHPNPGTGVAIVPRTGGDLRTTRHYYLSPHTSHLTGGVLFPRRPVRYGLQTVGPT